MYPRHVEEFEGSREYSLCLSCMEAAKIILGCEEKVQFLTKEDEKEETYEDFDFFLYTKLMDARDLIFKILQDRSLDMRLRMTCKEECGTMCFTRQMLYLKNTTVPEEMVISKKNWRELQDTAIMK